MRSSIRVGYVVSLSLFFLTYCGDGSSHKGTQNITCLGLAKVDFTSQGTQDTVADLVLGQDDFTSNIPNCPTGSVNQAGLSLPVAVAIDRSVVPNRIYVADSGNNRVLGRANANALFNGPGADLVIGQPDFVSTACNNGGVSARSLCNPKGMTVDSEGNLYVADRSNSRVVVYFTPFTATIVSGSGDNVADFIFGQTSFTKGGCSNPSSSAASASSLCAPYGVAVDSAGNVFVADLANNRVLEYDTPLLTDTIADRVFGQSDFESRASGYAADRLNQPNDVAVDRLGNVYVADFGNNRVLEFDAPLTTDSVADGVLGQPNFTSNLPNAGALFPSASTLHNPRGLAVDGDGNLYVADSSNRRVLEYDTPLTMDTVADRVFGQGPTGDNLTTLFCNGGGISETTLCIPYGVAVDGNGNLWVADFANNRVLEYDVPVPENVEFDKGPPLL